jgi:SAM-dependent methyltransferase
MDTPFHAGDDGSFGEDYYAQQGISGDRLALWYYARVARRLLKEGGRVLDFGCGTGHLLRRLSHSFEACGFDGSPTARALCRENAPDAVVLEDWQSIPPGSLDGIVTLHTLEHVGKPMSVVAELADRLVPGGRILIVVPNTASPGRRLKGEEWFAFRDPTHCSLLSRGEWTMILKRAGMRMLWVRGDGLWDAPYVGWLPAALQRVLFGAPAGLQVFSPVAVPFLPAALGECLIIAAEKAS